MTANVNDDPVNHPAHYTRHPSGIECIDIAERLSFNIGNAVKYLFRRCHKGNFEEDTRKSLWYLRREESRLLKIERWRPLIGDGRYDVSSLGRIKRWGRFRKLVQLKNGYMTFLVSRPEEKPKLYYAHREVMKAFVGTCPPGRCVAHGDGNKRNNALCNLRYATPTENSRDRERHGTVNSGARNGQSKLSEENVNEILKLNNKVSQESAAKSFGVSHSTIGRIWNGKSWKNQEPSPLSRFLSVESEESLLSIVLRHVTRDGGSTPESIALAAFAVEEHLKGSS